MKTKRVTLSNNGNQSAPSEKQGVSRAAKGGRPPKEAGLVSSEKLTLYLTPTEMKQLISSHQRAMQGAKLSMNEFIKKRLFTRQKVVKPASRSLTDYQLKKLCELVSELRHIGVNYNQSVKRINQYHFPDQLHREFQENAVLANEILELIRKTKNVYETLEN